MAVALYPGTFDPITFGHIDIATRATLIFSSVIAVVADNPSKKTLFTVDERITMMKQVFKNSPKIKVVRYDGLIVNCMQEYKATVIIRGLRAISDFEYEFQMAFTNRNMNSLAETVFLTPSTEYIYLNSSMVKQIARLGGDISSFVPKPVKNMLIKKLR